MPRRALLAASLLLVAGFGAESRAETEAIRASAPLTLTDHTGQPFDSDTALGGAPMIVYFGFANCPDICPFTLASLSEAFEALEAEGAAVEDIGFVFVTLDPERDTTEFLADYTDAFHPQLVGLTGTAAEIAKTAAAWEVPYSRTETDDPEVYFVDHPPYAFALDREHRVVGYLWHFAPLEKLTAAIRNLL